MEEDRAETNLGSIENDQPQIEPPEVPRVPKKRFVGRKTAITKEQPSTSNSTIEESSAIQGTLNPLLQSPIHPESI